MKEDIIEVNVKKVVEIKKNDNVIYLNDVDEILFLINELTIAYSDINKESLNE